jgi:hypothetical protein
VIYGRRRVGKMGGRPNPPCTARSLPSLKTVFQILVFFGTLSQSISKSGFKDNLEQAEGRFYTFLKDQEKV